MEFSVSILDYLGKINKGVLVLLSIVYKEKYYEATFFYNNEDMLLTPSDNLEKSLSIKIEQHPDYIELLKEILKKIAPYNEVIEQLKTI
jgi:hypothetical protein